MHKRILCCLSACAFVFSLAYLPQARAETDVTVGVDAWNTMVWGNIYKPDFARVTLSEDLNMSRHWNPHFFVRFATPGWWPNIRLAYGTMISNGSAHFALPICFLGHSIAGDVTSQAASKQGRILFAWHPVENEVVDLQTGLDLRWVTLNLAATGKLVMEKCSSGTSPNPPPTETSATYSASAGAVTWLPSINLGVTVHLPAHFDVFFNGSGLPYASNYIFDFRTGFKYHFGPGLSLVVGYRRWRLHLEDTSFSVNGSIDFKGPYAGLHWTF